MNERRLMVFFRLAFWVSVFLIFSLALVPASSATPSTGWDKLNHFLAFSLLAMLGGRAYPMRLGLVFGGLLAYGAGIEILQYFSPDRFAEWGDLLADGFGLLSGGAVFLLYVRIRRMLMRVNLGRGLDT